MRIANGLTSNLKPTASICEGLASHQPVLDEVAVDVGEAEVAALEAAVGRSWWKALPGTHCSVFHGVAGTPANENALLAKAEEGKPAEAGGKKMGERMR
jgi:hypothetical protein